MDKQMDDTLCKAQRISLCPSADGCWHWATSGYNMFRIRLLVVALVVCWACALPAGCVAIPMSHPV
jgi:hypothetical protein